MQTRVVVGLHDLTQLQLDRQFTLIDRKRLSPITTISGTKESTTANLAVFIRGSSFHADPWVGPIRQGLRRLRVRCATSVQRAPDSRRFRI